MIVLINTHKLSSCYKPNIEINDGTNQMFRKIFQPTYSVIFVKELSVFEQQVFEIEHHRPTKYT